MFILFRAGHIFLIYPKYPLLEKYLSFGQQVFELLNPGTWMAVV
jgi:hypothetical protein